MQLNIWWIAFYALIPAFVGFCGGLLATVVLPNPKSRSALQHFVGGIVVGAVAVELLPKILGTNHTWYTMSIGFLLGVIVMIALHWFSHWLAHKSKGKGLPLAMTIGIAIDLLIDGVLIGIAFLAGETSGVFIAIALSLCAFFLLLSLMVRMRKATFSVKKGLCWIGGVALLLPIGALIGSFVLNLLPVVILLETLAFGVAALLYLGIEELLGEAHKEHDTPWITSAFFLGFLVILAVSF